MLFTFIFLIPATATCEVVYAVRLHVFFQGLYQYRRMAVTSFSRVFSFHASVDGEAEQIETLLLNFMFLSLLEGAAEKNVCELRQ